MAQLNQQADLALAKVELRENILLLSDLLKEPGVNPQFYSYSSQAHFSYAFAFLEDHNKDAARRSYLHAFDHAVKALEHTGIRKADLYAATDRLAAKLQRLDKNTVPALYWLAVSWAKLIELKQPDLVSLTHLHKTALIMEKVMALDKYYQHAGAYVFFAIYYSFRPAYLGGNRTLAMDYFNRARAYNKNRLLMVDYLELKYLYSDSAHNKNQKRQLRFILQAPVDIHPEQKLMNQVAKQKAASLLSG